MQPIAKSREADTLKYKGIKMIKNIKELRNLKMKTIKHLLFLLISSLICGQVLAQATLLPNAKQSFTDANGKPLTSGTVDFYIPGTTNRKTTWQNAEQTILNTNPVVLDAAGRAIIYGSGSYRQVVKDRSNNIIWDQITSSTGSSGGGGGGSDGNPVGSVLIWSGFNPPTNYVFAYGQEVSRISFPDYLGVITQTLTVNCSSGSPILTGLTSTEQLAVNSKIESTCAQAGSFIISKTSTTVTMNANSLASTSASAVFFPYGNGDGVTTYNIPDYRGRVIAGRPNMGGNDSARLTSTYYGVNPLALGASGGNESQTLTAAQLPSNIPNSLTGTAESPATFSILLTQGNTLQGGGVGVSQGAVLPSGGVNSLNLSITGSINPSGGNPHTIIQPTITANYVVKILSSN